MLSRRFSICVLAGLLSAPVLHAQSVNLTEAPLADRCVRNELVMDLDGKISIKQDGKDISFPQKAQAKHVFVERFLDAASVVADKAVRQYATAESTLTFNNNDSSKRSLRADRRFLVTQRLKGQVVTFSPDGAMTRDEVELTEHFDTMAVAGLLPGKTLEVGKTWSIPNSVVLSLCELDGVTSQSLEGTLETVKDDIALGKIVGKVQGINLGAEVVMQINARFAFDVKAQRITTVEWKESDVRQQGPITPALTAEVTINLTRTPIAEPESLNKLALLKVPTTATPPSELTGIVHQDAKKRFSLKYARDWHVTSPEDSPQLVMRHLERGDFIAQVTVTAWKKVDPKNVITLKDFAEEMAKTPGWAEDKEIERKQVTEIAKGHHAVYRVAATGELDGVRTVQYFYLVVGAQGDQLLVTFSVVPQHIARIGVRDLELVREIVFP
ncbi:MAG: hypothetical protein HY289_04365 [Planctomycetes bacterium]|nr:hypothetical protein [Planctomycetota bacterium]